MLKLAFAIALAGFTTTGQFQEQVRVLAIEPGVRVTIVAPPARQFDPARPNLLIVYALPNGNTTEQTIGRAGAGLDWHFDIQHIGAQTRLLRQAMSDRNVIVAYLENDLKSWPAWRQKNPQQSLVAILDRVKAAIPSGLTDICLTGHSGGGSFIFGYINELPAIPVDIERIAFLDSNYNFDDAQHGAKLVAWLGGENSRRLQVLAYDDRNIELDGKRVVSDTGGTYRASLRMVESLRKNGIALEESRSGPFLRYAAPHVEILVHQNPENKILHTMLIGEMNGYIHALTVGTPWERKLGSMFDPGAGPRGYSAFVERSVLTGTAFIESLKNLDRNEREAAILRELKAGNVPNFLRQMIPVTVKAKLADGVEHTVVYEVMPDYLAIGTDADFVRMPMNPYTAQAYCDAADLAMPTRKMSNDIWKQAAVKLIPQPLTQDRESPSTFLQNHRLIEEQATGVPRGEIWAGIKKDVVITNRLQERPQRVAIYGWHYPSGDAIQPLTIVHVDWYVDYSHGLRPVRNTVKVDGREMRYEDVLRDPVLSALLSDEGPIAIARYEPRP